MIQARCLHRPGRRFTNRTVALASSARLHQKSYFAFAGAILRHEHVINPLTQRLQPWRLRQWPPQHLNSKSVSRSASTTPTSPPVAQVQSDYVPPPPTSAPAGDDFLSTSLDEVTSSVPPPVYDHLGFLKEMGLDYGWGPTAFMETLLEHVHVYLATPWWASIGISMLIVRAALFKFYIEAADTSARRQTIKHLSDPIVARMSAARADNNANALQEAMIEQASLNRSAGIKMWKTFVPFLQVPIGFGTFRLMRGMAHLPVPGLDTGGLLWVSDLTQSDPYLVLPSATTVVIYLTFKKGGEIGNNALISQRAQKVFTYVTPLISGCFMIYWPGGLQLTFFISGLISYMQATLFRSPWFRDLVGMQPLPEPAAPISRSQTSLRYQAPSGTQSRAEAAKGILGNIKGAVSDIMKAGEQFSGMSRQQAQKGRLTAAEKQHAKAYDEKRNRELAREAKMRREEAQAKFERLQEQEIREHERKERRQRRAAKKASQKQ